MKVLGLKDYFQDTKPELQVRYGWDFDTRSASFPFDDGNEVKHLIRINARVLQDYALPQIIERLEAANWTDFLETMSPLQMAVFTSNGFLTKPRPC